MKKYYFSAPGPGHAEAVQIRSPGAGSRAGVEGFWLTRAWT